MEREDRLCVDKDRNVALRAIRAVARKALSPCCTRPVKRHASARITKIALGWTLCSAQAARSGKDVATVGGFEQIALLEATESQRLQIEFGVACPGRKFGQGETDRW